MNIYLNDVNDSPPVFEQPIYEENILEDAKTSETILRVHATDADEGTNGRITYVVESGSGLGKC